MGASIKYGHLDRGFHQKRAPHIEIAIFPIQTKDTGEGWVQIVPILSGPVTHGMNISFVIYMRTYTHAYAHQRTHAHSRMHASMRACMCAHAYKDIHTRACAHARTSTHAHTRTHTLYTNGIN